MADRQVHSALQEAVALHQKGQLAQAQTLYESILKTQPSHFDALHLLGVIAAQTGHYPRALELMGKAIAINPNHAEAYCNQGKAFEGLKEYAAALASYDKAVTCDPKYASAHFYQGNMRKVLGQLEAALSSYDRVVALEPDRAEGYSNRGVVLQELGRLDDALSSYDKALRLNPGYAEAYYNRALALQALQQWDAALASYDRAIAINPNYAEAYTNRGNVLKELGRLGDALASHNRALALKSDCTEAYSNRGAVLQDLGKPDEALADFDRALSLKPDYANAYWNKSMIKLLQGEYEEGWKLYEWRWKGDSKIIPRPFTHPVWSGEKLPAGKRILIHAEQGFGDTLQFCRYVPMVAKDNKVIFECYKQLVPLMQYNFPGVRVVEEASDYPGIKGLPEYDFHMPLLSLPHVFGTTLATIPSAPYLGAPPEKVEKWKPVLEKKLGKALRIGLCWAGGKRPDRQDCVSTDARRSLTFAQIKPLLDVRGAAFVSLQLGPSQREIDDNRVKDISGQIKDWSDTAAVITLLDLVISVDTAVCHLAAAMGTKTFLLNRYDTCWRWLLDRGDSPWYPSLTQFRQKTAGDWVEVIARVKEKLAEGLSQ